MYSAMSETDAKNRGLEFESIKGDIRLLQELMDGNWNEDDFLLIPAQNKITATYDEAIMSYDIDL